MSLMTGPESVSTTDVRTRQLFDETIPAKLRATPARFIHGFRFVVDLGDLGAWTVDLSAPAPSCRPGRDDSADLVFETTGEVFDVMLREPQNMIEQYYRGAIRLKGDFAVSRKAPEILARLAGADTGEPEPEAVETPGLAALLAPYGVTPFLSNHWPDVSLVLHGPLERFAWVSDILGFKTTEDLLDVWKGEAAVFPKRSGDEFDAPNVSRDQARTLWDRGFALLFGGVDRHRPALRGVLEQLQRDLGLPRFTNGRCSAYATPPGAGATPHFDHNTNFVIQLTGEKVWTLAPNTSVSRPTSRYVIGGPRPKGELVAELEAPLPEAFPEPREVVTLRPGSLLFVPRGYWHTTRGAEPALSLNFTFDQPCWALVAADAVRRQLVSSRAWRELAWDLDSPVPEHAARARDCLRSLLPTLVEEVGRIDYDALVSAARARPSPIRPPSKPEPPRDWVKILTA